MRDAFVYCSGHTSAVALSITEGGTCRAVQANPTNLHHSELNDGVSGVQEACVKLGLRDLENLRAVLVLPGISTNRDVKLGNELLSKSGFQKPNNTYLLDDTVASLLANHHSLSATCAFCGSGASVFCGGDLNRPPMSVGKPNKLDGWGPFLGDRGSGVSIGLALLSKLCKHRDWGKERERLEIIEEVLRIAPELQNFEDIQNWFDNVLQTPPGRWKMLIASFASVVTNRLAKYPDDDFCSELIDESADDLFWTVSRSIELNSPSSDVVICQGGMFRHSKSFFEKVAEKLMAKKFVAKLASCHPVVGGLSIAINDEWLPSERAKVEGVLATCDSESKSLVFYPQE